MHYLSPLLWVLLLPLGLSAQHSLGAWLQGRDYQARLGLSLAELIPLSADSRTRYGYQRLSDLLLPALALNPDSSFCFKPLIDCRHEQIYSHWQQGPWQYRGFRLLKRDNGPTYPSQSLWQQELVLALGGQLRYRAWRLGLTWRQELLLSAQFWQSQQRYALSLWQTGDLPSYRRSAEVYLLYRRLGLYARYAPRDTWALWLLGLSWRV